MDEGFVDESVVAAPSISEDLLTVGVRAPADEEEEDDDDDDDDNDNDDDDEGADDDDEPDQVRMYIYSANELCITQHGTISMIGPVPPQQLPLPPQQPPVPPQQPPVLQWTPENTWMGEGRTVSRDTCGINGVSCVNCPSQHHQGSL